LPAEHEVVIAMASNVSFETPASSGIPIAIRES